jgi:hypothetical protein
MKPETFEIAIQWLGGGNEDKIIVSAQEKVTIRRITIASIDKKIRERSLISWRCVL